MGSIASKWSGKCRRCRSPHNAGDFVWWEKGFKGVLCLNCARVPAPATPSPTDNDEEDDDLKVPKPETLKPGHRLSLTSNQFSIGADSLRSLNHAYCVPLHAKDCNCGACVISENAGAWSFYVMDNQMYNGSNLPRGLVFPEPVVKKFHIRCGEYYNVLCVEADEKRVLCMKIPTACIAPAGMSYAPYQIMKVTAGAPNKEPLRLAGAAHYVAPRYEGNQEREEIARRYEGLQPTVTDCAGGVYEEKRLKSTVSNDMLNGHNPFFVHRAGIQASGILIKPLLNGLVGHGDDCNCRQCMGIRGITSGTEQLEVRGLANLNGGVTQWCIGPKDKSDWNLYLKTPTGASQVAIACELGIIIPEYPSYILPNDEPIPSSDAPEPIPGFGMRAGSDPTKQEVPTPVTSANLSDAAVSLVAALQASAVPEAKVREIALETITAELKKLPAKNHKIKFNDAPPVDFEGTMHSMATEIMEAILCGFHNIMVVGPAGSGKTFLFSQIAALLRKEMKWDEDDYAASMSCAPGQTESMFIGRMIPSLTTGQEIYHGTNLTRLYSKENGGAFLFDEISNSEPTVMNLVNAMIALDGHVTLPDGRVLTRPKNMVVFAADNTWGQGGDRMYIRNQLDAATLDRFTGAKFFMDYDEKLEQSICPLKEVYDAVQGLRKRTVDLKLRRIVSTRAFAAAHRMGSNGMNQKNILKRLTIDWSENDRKSVGV